MAAALDRAAFFAAVRLNPFPGHLTPSQVSGMEAILDACPPDFPLDFLAYCLGTCPIETAWTMRPIEEIGRGRGKAYGPSGFWGRGYVQLTWSANYTKATKRLRELGYLTANQDLTKTPDLAMDPTIAAAILFIGTAEGWFTGKKLADYFGGGKADWTGARRIINGQDRAAEIGMHAQACAKALKAAGYVPGGVVAKIPVPPVVVAPLPVPAPAPPPVIPLPAQPAPQPAAHGGIVSFLRRVFGPYKKVS